MRRSKFACIAAAIAATAVPSSAYAETPAYGFALERLYRSAPGQGWLVMDALDMRGGFGGALELATGYAKNPLHVASNGQTIDVVGEQAFANIGIAVTYDRFRLYMNFDHPLLVNGLHGNTAQVGPYTYTGPTVDLGSHPDTAADFRIGFDARLFGDPKGPFRLGTSTQLFIASGATADYVTDGSYRAMERLLVAGDLGPFTYAGQVGLHVRGVAPHAAPGTPQGDELLLGVAAGPRIPLDRGGHTSLIVGPEVFGETALKSFLGGAATGLEALLTARVEGADDDGAQMQVKLSAGGGLLREFGTPDWRIAFAVSLFDHSTDTDHDGVSDKYDACPRTPGVRDRDPKANGCPTTEPK